MHNQMGHRMFVEKLNFPSLINHFVNEAKHSLSSSRVHSLHFCWKAENNTPITSSILYRKSWRGVRDRRHAFRRSQGRLRARIVFIQTSVHNGSSISTSGGLHNAVASMLGFAILVSSLGELPHTPVPDDSTKQHCACKWLSSFFGSSGSLVLPSFQPPTFLACKLL